MEFVKHSKHETCPNVRSQRRTNSGYARTWEGLLKILFRKDIELEKSDGGGGNCNSEGP
jgi:hypothetical protein